MKIKILLSLVFSLPALLSGGADSTFEIRVNDANPVQYCTTPVNVASLLTIQGTATVQGFKISISEGYRYGEDELVVVNPGGLNPTWSEANGTLILTGSTLIQDYIAAIRSIQYRNLKAKPTLGERKITISMSDVDYLPATGHFYRFISNPNITWTGADAEAKSDARVYFGLRGYLATITSKAEDDFISLKTNGVGWIGASDRMVEGEWRWITGPEGLMDGGKGLLFWKGSGMQAKNNPAIYGPVPDASGVPAYHNWNRWDTPNPTGSAMYYEPNDNNRTTVDHEEDYGHITYFPNNPSESKRWNDYPDIRSSAGYLIEWGGMENVVVNLSATIVLQVNTMLFNTDPLPELCEGETVTLNKQDPLWTPASYSWTNSATLSDASSASPVATPLRSEEYTVTGIRGNCRDTRVYRLTLNKNPLSLLGSEINICQGETIKLDPGDPGVPSAFLWSPGGETTRSITVGTTGTYELVITSNKNCITRNNVRLQVHSKPVINLSELQTVICDKKSETLKISKDKGSWLFYDSAHNLSFTDPLITVPAWGDYPFEVKVTDAYGCASTDNFVMRFHKRPAVNFSLDETTCVGYNLQAEYIGDATISKSLFTWEFGGQIISSETGRSSELIPLGIGQAKRDLKLTVMEDGCDNSKTIPDISVIPNLDMSVDKKLQCQFEPFNFSAFNTETGVRYDWDWGDGTTGTGREATHAFRTSGEFDITLKVTTDKGCSNRATIPKMIFVAPIPTVGFSISPETCLNPGKDTLYYSGSAGPEDKFYWDLKGFDPEEIVRSPESTAGPFVFDLVNKPKTGLSLYVISQYGCKSPVGNLELKRKPVFSFVTDQDKGCAPLDIGFEARPEDPVDRLEFSWNYGDGGSGVGDATGHTYQEPGRQHDVTLSASSSLTGCADSLKEQNLIVVHPDPKAEFIMDHEIVYNDSPSVKFTDSSSDAVNWLWDFGDKTISREKDPVHSYEVVGRRKVILTVYNEFDCRDTTSRSLLVAFSRIFAPNAIAPGAPREIDRVFLLASEGIRKEGYHLKIISRWNDVVFECKDEIKGWDGKMSNGHFAPAGNYVWILECVDFLGRPHRQSGSLALVF